MSNVEERPYVPAKIVPTDYPLIDNDPHIKRVIGYARPDDYAYGAVSAAFGPGMMLLWERVAPSYASKASFSSAMRLAGAVGVTAGFFIFYQRSLLRFYGFTENKREEDMDMREMVAKVKKGEPLYGTSTLSAYNQGMAARNSRYAGLMLHTIPWFNFVNHNHHGVDTAKYYQQAERELEAEKLGQGKSGT